MDAYFVVTRVMSSVSQEVVEMQAFVAQGRLTPCRRKVSECSYDLLRLRSVTVACLKATLLHFHARSCGLCFRILPTMGQSVSATRAGLQAGARAQPYAAQYINQNMEQLGFLYRMAQHNKLDIAVGTFIAGFRNPGCQNNYQLPITK